jgi:hypothetical protein
VPFKGPIITNSDLAAHFCRFTSKTFAALQGSELRSEVWLRGIPWVAIQHESVSHAVSALSAMNLWWLSTMEEQNRTNVGALEEFYQPGSTVKVPRTKYPPHVYMDQAQVHYGRCLQLYQEDLKYLNPENADAVLACAAMLGVCGVVHSQMERSGTRRSGSSKSSPSSGSSAVSTPQHTNPGPREGGVVDLRWIQLFRGIKSVRDLFLLQGIDLRDVSTVFPLVEPSQNDWQSHSPRYSSPPSSPPHTNPGKAVYSVIMDEGQSALAHLRNLIESRLSVLQSVASLGSKPSWNISSLEICLQSLQKLQNITSVFGDTIHPSHRMLMVWIAGADPAYIDLLGQQDEVAVAIYAHFLVYTMLLDDLWWVSDLGISALADILDFVGGNEMYEIDITTVSQTLFSWPAKISRLYEQDLV